MDGTPCCPQQRTFMSLSANDLRLAAQSWKRSIPTNIIAGHELSEVISTLQSMGQFSVGHCCCCTFIKVPLISCRKVRSCEAQSRSFLEQCLQAQSMASLKHGDDKKFGKDEKSGLHQSMRTSKTDKARKSDEGGLAEGGKGKKKKGGVGAEGTDEDRARQSGRSGKSKKGKTKAGDESDSDEDGKGGKKKKKSGTRKGAKGTDDDDEDDETGGKKGKKSKKDAKKKKKDKTSDFEEGKIEKSKAAEAFSKFDKKTGKKGKKKASGESGDSDAVSGKKLKGKKQKIDAAKKSKKSKRLRGLRGEGSTTSTAGESGRLHFGKFELTKEEKERRKAKDRAVKCHMIIEANRIKRVQLLKVTGSKSLSDMIERKMKEKEKQLKDKPYNDVGRMFDSNCSSVTSLTKPNINVFFEHGCADPVKALKLFSFDEQMISNERSFNIGERTGNGCPRNTCYLCNR